MAHQNEERFREGLAAFQRGDLEAVQAFFSDDVVWHVPGRSPLSGDYKGKQEVLGFFGKTMELTGGTFKLDVHDVLANDDHGVAMITTMGEREGKTLHSRGVQVLHFRDEQVVESWLHPDDQYAIDEFWS